MFTGVFFQLVSFCTGSVAHLVCNIPLVRCSDLWIRLHKLKAHADPIAIYKQITTITTKDISKNITKCNCAHMCDICRPGQKN